MRAILKPSPANEQVFKELERLFASIARPTAAQLKPVSAAVRAGFAENFSQEQAGDHGPWAQLRPFTIAERIAAGYGGAHPILVRTGAYRRSFVDIGAAGHVEEVQNTSSGVEMEIGSDDERAFIHEEGFGNVPARPVTFLGATSEGRIGEALDRMFAGLGR